MNRLNARTKKVLWPQKTVSSLSFQMHLVIRTNLLRSSYKLHLHFGSTYGQTVFQCQQKSVSSSVSLSFHFSRACFEFFERCARRALIGRTRLARKQNKNKYSEKKKEIIL